jgi:adenine-specific DNA methylase
VLGNPKWDNAMDEEMVALDVNVTWELVALPKDKKIIGHKWVYKVKHNANGSMNIYKTKFIAKGYAKTYGIDYEETYSLLAKMIIVKVIIATIVAKGWSSHQMDVKNVFLHGDLQEEVYMEQPLGYVDQTHPNLVYKLKKTLYGLKQAPRAWSNKIGQYLVTNEFQTSSVDFTLCVKKIDHGIVIIVIYVDDLIIIRDSDEDIFDLKKFLKQKFEMKDLGELRYFFGIEII